MDALLAAWNLNPPESERDGLDHVVGTIRREGRRRPAGVDLPKVERRALNHAKALLSYAETPPKRASSVSLRRQKLLAALNEGGAALAFALWIRGDGFNELAALQDALKAGRSDADLLARFVVAVEASRSIADPAGRREDSRYPGLVRVAAYHWRLAGYPCGYTWPKDEAPSPHKVGGQFAAFVRDLIAVCQLPTPSETNLHRLLHESVGQIRKQSRTARPDPPAAAFKKWSKP